MPEDQESKMEIYTDPSVKLSLVSEIGGFAQVGEYIARLSRLDPTTSKKGDPMLNAHFEVLEGPHEGEEIRFNFWLGARKDKKSGRIFAPGVAEIRSACAAAGTPISSEDFKLEAVSAGRIFGAALYGKKVRIKILPDTDRKDAEGNKVEGKWEGGKWEGPTRPKLLGLATPGQPAATGIAADVPSNPLSGIV